VAKLEYRIVNTAAGTIFSERFPTEEAAHGRLNQYRRMWSDDTTCKYLKIYIASDTPEPYRGPAGYADEEMEAL
jgi:hypothetical protein